MSRIKMHYDYTKDLMVTVTCSGCSDFSETEHVDNMLALEEAARRHLEEMHGED